MSGQSLHQRQEQRQEQIMAPQQIQSLEFLILQSAELQTKINKEIEENPVLELETPRQDSQESPPETTDDRIPEGEPEKDAPVSENESSADEGDKIFDEVGYSPKTERTEGSDDEVNRMDELVEWSGLYENSSNVPTSGINPDYEEKRRHFMDSITREPSLQEQLLEQLHLSNFAPEKMKLAELVIGSIDDQGYIRSHPADLATAASVSIKEVEEMIRAIQQFDPPGIGARDLKECLLLQLEALGKSNSKVAYLVKHHLDDLAKNRLPHISKKMNLSLVELQGVIDEVRKLNPNPGLSLVPDNPIFVAPEVFVERKGDAFVVMTNKDSLPRLRVSKTYLKMLDDPNISCEAKTYIKEKIIRAKNVMRSLVQRESTIKRIADVIVDEQYEFFLKGIEFLKPQTMQKVADKLGLHETTISRATTNKFMQTPHGLFEFKFFFSGGYQANNGEEMSSKSVMEKIREMILAEDSESPLSDQMITDELGKQGLNVARRTVAKYREELGIISSHLRKQHL